MAEFDSASENMMHAVNLGAYYLEAGLRDFGEWSEQMVADAGEKIRPHLQEVWRAANAELEEANCAEPGALGGGDAERPSGGDAALATGATEPGFSGEAWELLLKECRRRKKPWLAFLLALFIGPVGVFYIGVNFGLSAVVVWGILAAPAAMWAPSWHWMVWVANLLLAIHASDLAQKRNALLSASLLAMAEAPTSEELKGVFNFWSGPYAVNTLANEFLPSAAFWMALVEMVRQAIGLFRDHVIGAGILMLVLSCPAAFFAAWFYGLIGGIVALLGTGIHWLAAKLSRQPLWFPDA